MRNLFLRALPLFLFLTTSAAWSGEMLPGEVISAEELKGKLEGSPKVLLLDARDKKTFDAGHIHSARLPRSDEFYRQEELFRTGLSPAAPSAPAALEEGMKQVPKDQPIVTYCNSNCHASAVLAQQLRQLGFRDVRSMEEGYQQWEQKGYPVVKEPSPAYKEAAPHPSA